MKCEVCYDTGWYGDNGPGIAGNTEYQECDQCDCLDPLDEEAVLLHQRMRQQANAHRARVVREMRMEERDE
jgi:hypothetical protein